MFTSIASVSISGRLDAKLRAIAEAGFDGVELVENDLLTYDGSAADDAFEPTMSRSQPTCSMISN